MATEGKVKPFASTMSRARYNAIEAVMRERTNDPRVVLDVMTSICAIMRFDPTAKQQYDPIKSLKQRERVKEEAKELGVSTYELQNRRKYYEKRKGQAAASKAMDAASEPA